MTNSQHFPKENSLGLQGEGSSCLQTVLRTLKQIEPHFIFLQYCKVDNYRKENSRSFQSLLAWQTSSQLPFVLSLRSHLYN